MDVMRVMRWNGMDAAARAAPGARGLSAGSTPGLRAAAGGWLADVRLHGDDALCRALARFDGVDVEPDGLPVSDAEFAAARAAVPAALLVAIRDMIDHIRRFNERLLERRGD